MTSSISQPKSKNCKYNEINNLKLFDVKAQKKTIPWKKFCKIPLTYEESLKENFDATKQNFLSPSETNLSSSFYTMSTMKKQSLKKKRQFSCFKPKLFESHTISSGKMEKEEKINKILLKCNRLLKNGSGFKGKFQRFEKGSRRCLDEIKQKLDFLLTNQGGNWNLM